MRAMWSEIGEIVLWMALAALVGVVVGGLFGWISGKAQAGAQALRDTHETHHRHATQLTSLQDELGAAQARIARLQAELSGSTRHSAPTAEDVEETGDDWSGLPAAPPAAAGVPASGSDARVHQLAATVGDVPTGEADWPGTTLDVEEIEGIGPGYAERLRSAGVTTVAELLAIAGTADGRRELAAKARVREEFLVTWAAQADLLRVAGVDPQAAELLEAAGVDSPLALAGRGANELVATLERVNGEQHLVADVPDEPTAALWIAAAVGLGQRVSR